MADIGSGRGVGVGVGVEGFVTFHMGLHLRFWAAGDMGTIHGDTALETASTRDSTMFLVFSFLLPIQSPRSYSDVCPSKCPCKAPHDSCHNQTAPF